jgi:23S rRNA (guanosine2251-2'-O)-methyltransferase
MGEETMGEEMLYGVHAVVGALRNERRRVSKVLVDERRRDAPAQQIKTLTDQRGISVETVSRAQLNRTLGHSRHQGVAAVVESLEYGSLGDMREGIETATDSQTLLVLDGVTDVGNFASLVRSAAAFGVDTIIMPRHRSVPLTSAVAKRSAGVIEQVSVVRVTNLAKTLDELKKQGFWIYGTAVQADRQVGQVQWPERIVIVLGAEGTGMRRLVRERCDVLVRIPMRAGSNSVNVAVAGAIVLAYAWEQRCLVEGAAGC